MKPVLEFSTIRPGLFHWQGYETEVKCDCSSTAIVTPDGLIFIDPIPLAEEALQELIAESGSMPASIVLTSGNHQRESLAFAKKFGIPIIAPEEAGEEIIADQHFVAGEKVTGMDSVALPGFGPGETAFLYDGVLILGDALINLEPEALRLLPEKYCLDKKAAHRSLEVLKSLKPEIICFAHGNPIVQDASRRLNALS